MNHHKPFWIIALVLLGVLSLALPLTAQEEEPERTGFRPDAPAFAVRGPYAVGMTEMMIEDDEHPLQVSVWYPASNPENRDESIIYDAVMKWTPMPDSDYVVFGQALLDAAPNATDAPYPLLVFSPGYANFATVYSYLYEHLASYGFVVLAPDHVEHYYFDEDPFRDGPQTTIDRPQDISKVIDYAQLLTDSNDMFQGMIDMEQVAVSGHSYGGYTTLAAAGARYDFEGYIATCAEVSEAIAGNMLCDNLAPHEEDMAQHAGLESMPEGLWPSMGDPRVKAIVPLAGDAYLFGEAGLAEVNVPMLAIGGTLDDATPYEWGTRFAYDNVSSQQKSLVTIESGNHYLFHEPCVDMPWLLEMGAFSFCSDSVWDVDRAHDLVNHFSTAFLLDVLKGDEEAHTALMPENVSFPGITYETTMQ